MVTPEFQRINLDYNRKMAELQRQKESAEKDEYSRMAKRYDEANLAAKAIEEDKLSSSANTDCSESEQETTLQRESQEPSTSTSSNLSFERKEETEITFKRFIEPPKDGPRAKKRSLAHAKPHIQQSVDNSEVLTILNSLKKDISTLREDNIAIMRRLAILESPDAPITSASAETAQKGAYLALKMDWVPRILKLLNLIYAEVQTPDDEK